MKSGIVQKIFKDHFTAYRTKHGVSPREWRAAHNIMTCRTEKQGYHIDKCPNGHHMVILKNSCKHRSCPQCGSTETEVWLERRKLQALDCSYYQVIYTISHDLHPIWRWNRRLFTNLLFLAAWHSLRELLLSERWLGALTGAIGVFQSWDDHLLEHCHLHFIVPAGGLDKTGKWKDVEGDILLPTPVLASKFRGKFLAYLRESFNSRTDGGEEKPKNHVLIAPEGMSTQQCLNLINKLGRIKWHVDIEPPYEHANGVFKYVGRYIRRGPISEKRISSYDGEEVTISYAHPEKHKKPSFKINAGTFIRRILSHVPEPRNHLVRSYGLLHPSCIKKLNLARLQLGQGPYEPLTDLPHAQELLARMFPDWDAIRCPECGALLQTVYVDRRSQGPPLDIAV